MTAGAEKVALTDRDWLSVTVQVVAKPVQAPSQPRNVEPAADAAVSVTAVFAVNVALQVVPQLIPVGELVTVPAPDPALATLSVFSGSAKSAVTFCAWFIVSVQVAVVPVQAPDQPVKVEPAAGDAVKVTKVFAVKPAAQPLPQLIPAGELTTVPVPEPVLVTVNVCGINEKLAFTVCA